MFNQYTHKSINSLNRSMQALNSSVENVNNMFTASYKAEKTTFHETLDGLKVSSHRDFKSGTPKRTDRELDFAIDGVGFFEVQLPDGTLAYTRLGDFRLSPSGELVSSHGYPLTQKVAPNISDINNAYDDIEEKPSGSFNLSVLSKKIKVPTGKPIVLEEDGTLKTKEGDSVGKIFIAAFPNLNGLKPVGDGLYLATEEAGAIEEVKIGEEENKTSVRQGHLESSNINIVDEMAKITQQNTAAKAQMKIIKLFDQMQESLNSTISRNV